MVSSKEGMDMRNLLIPILLGLCVIGVQKCKTVEIDEQPPGTGVKDTTTYSCAGKTQCSEMKSCEEAKYYLDHCPDVYTDGDGDGIPCEDQLCGH
ncbi:MAG: cold-shock protein [Fibrobacteres bacterium]|nr:cold-shock protein [Fibrobacterota bacterium]